MLMRKILQTTFYAHLSRIWKLARFTRFIRKVFATKSCYPENFVFFWLWERGINPWAMKLKKSKMLPPLFRRLPTWRSLHAAATYSGTAKNSHSKRKQGAVVRKQLFKKKTRNSCSQNSSSKRKQGTVAWKTVFSKRKGRYHFLLMFCFCFGANRSVLGWFEEFLPLSRPQLWASLPLCRWTEGACKVCLMWIVWELHFLSQGKFSWALIKILSMQIQHPFPNV